jgi:hypothetical protein
MIIVRGRIVQTVAEGDPVFLTALPCEGQFVVLPEIIEKDAHNHSSSHK